MRVKCGSLMIPLLAVAGATSANPALPAPRPPADAAQPADAPKPALPAPLPPADAAQPADAPKPEPVTPKADDGHQAASKSPQAKPTAHDEPRPEKRPSGKAAEDEGKARSDRDPFVPSPTPAEAGTQRTPAPVSEPSPVAAVAPAAPEPQPASRWPVAAVGVLLAAVLSGGGLWAASRHRPSA